MAMIIDRPTQYVTQLRVSESGQKVAWRLQWTEEITKSLKMYIAPQFYFYTLIHDILPIQPHQSITEYWDRLYQWTKKHNFEPEIMDLDETGFIGLFSNPVVALNLENYPKNKNNNNNLLPVYQPGQLLLEVNRSLNSAEIKIKFLMEYAGDVPNKDLECNLIYMNKIKFDGDIMYPEEEEKKE